MKLVSPRVLALLLVLFAAGFVHGEPAGSDVWTRVRSTNFVLVGNASEKDIRKVGTRLEQFRETFRTLFGTMDLAASIPTTVIVFKNDAAYREFKPKRSDGSIDVSVTGFFQPGEDENFITLSAEGDDARLNVIFHEYVHFIVDTNFGKSNVPAWFNEGLAEYYETFAIEGDQKVKLGLPQSRHLAVLRSSKLLPLRTLFATNNAQLLEMPDEPRKLFYAESWALVHYLNHVVKAGKLNAFFQSLIKGTAPETAFRDTFQTTYDKMEADLKRYVERSLFDYNELTLGSKLVFDADMRSEVIDQPHANEYLGDLLYHMGRANDAEPLIAGALAAMPRSSVANTAMAMIRIKQERFAEARPFLEAAIAADARNHLAYYNYAYLLTRETGAVEAAFTPEQAEKIRRILYKAIELAPAFTESYDLLAYVDLVRGEHLDKAFAAIQTALRYQPGNQSYALRVADIYAAQERYAEADSIVRKVADNADNAEIRSRAASMTEQIAKARQAVEQMAADRRAEAAEAAATRKADAASSAAEDPYAVVRSINQALRKVQPNETRVVGRIARIDCGTRPLAFVVTSGQGSFMVTSPDFESLDLGAFVAGSDQRQIGCDTDLSRDTAVITYRPLPAAKNGSRGDLVSIEFVPADFQFLDPLPMSPDLLRKLQPDPNARTGPLMDPPPARTPEEERTRQKLRFQGIRESLPKPAEGQRQEIGFLDKVECSDSGVYLTFRSGARTLRLLNPSPASMRIAIFATELAGMKFGCSMGPVTTPAVFIYTDKPDLTAKTDGEIAALSFVPSGFTIEP